MPRQVEPLQQIVQSTFQDVTPVRLRLLLVVDFLGALLFCLVASATVQQHEHAVKTVGMDAAPSVIEAHEIKIGVEKMDTDLANELLYAAGDPDGQAMAEDFERWRLAVGKHLVAVARNITYGTAELVPIENIQTALGRFEMQSQSARDLHKSGKHEDAISAYESALNTLQEVLLPNADALNKANSDALESTYSEEKSESALSRGLVLVTGMLLVALLVYTQLYLRTRFHRRLNLPLLIATVCTAVFVHHLTLALAHNSQHLKIAKEDAYNSVVALLDARSNAYDANAAESRRMLDRKQIAVHEKHFADQMATVARFAAGHDFSDTIAHARQQPENNEKVNLPGFSGSLADELNNIRFEGEGQAALDALEAFRDYSAVDDKIRQLESSGQHDAAVKLCLSYNPNGSKFPFTRLDNALGRTLQINQDHFERAVKEAFGDLDGLAVVSQLVSVLIAICAYLGLRPRMAEYV